MEQPLVIGVLCDDKVLGPHHFHCAGDKYVRAVSEVMGAIPVLIPVLGDQLNIEAMLQILDGLLLPGAYSNIDPMYYGQENEEAEPLRDPARDTSAFAVVHGAMDQGLPLFAICRGFQEVNVALGGSLFQRVQLEEGMQDHRENSQLPLDQQYADVHPINLFSGGKLASLSSKRQVQVNSLHQQGVCELAPLLRVEATSEDGLIEAYSLESDEQFLLGVQWHPEWQVMNNPFNRSLFITFAQACAEFKKYNR